MAISYDTAFFPDRVSDALPHSLGAANYEDSGPDQQLVRQILVKVLPATGNIQRQDSTLTVRESVRGIFGRGDRQFFVRFALSTIAR